MKILIAICVLWAQVPSSDWEESGERIFLPRKERAFVVESANECAVNLWKMNLEALEHDAKYSCTLIQVNLETGKIDTLQLPTIRFEK